MPEVIQVITDELEYVNHLEKYIQEEGMDKIGSAYKNVAIIGCQSSGKSTLLNILFDTSFEELNQRDRGMAQTTKGIWAARNSEKDILIFDIEGTDSRERGDDRLTFEQTTSLFALAIADVLIINLWTTDVGRHTASNLGLLKVIFEVNLKLFAQDQSHKKLIFVLRDFNRHENNEDQIIRLLERNVSDIWDQIYKDPMHETSNPHDFFDFEFCMLPHKIYQKEEFEEEGKKLRQRFRPDDYNSVFPTSDKDNVPVDGLPLFIKNIWTCIRERKELNLPGEKEMVANFRCHEIKNEAIEKVSGELSDLENLSNQNVIENFKERCMEVIDIAYKYYDESAIQYYNKTYVEVRQELTKEIMKKLTACFENQINSQRIVFEQKFDKGMKNSFKDNEVTDTFVDDTNELMRQSLEGYRYMCENLILEGSGWRYEVSYNELKHRIKDRVELEREKQLERLFEFSKENLSDDLEKELISPIVNLEDNFWSIVNKTYVDSLKKHESDMKEILVKGFQTTEDDYDLFVAKFEDEIYKFSKKLIIKACSDLNSHLNRKFNSYFKLDEKGKHRDWKNISEEKITQLHEEWYQQFESIYDQFLDIELPSRPNSATPSMGSIYKKKDSLLSREDLIKIKDKFADDWEHALEEAMRLHHNIYGGGIPIYFWALFLFFAYDDIFRWLASPLVYTPLLLIGTTAGLLQSLGILMPLVKAASVSFKILYGQVTEARLKR